MCQFSGWMWACNPFICMQICQTRMWQLTLFEKWLLSCKWMITWTLFNSLVSASLTGCESTHLTIYGHCYINSRFYFLFFFSRLFLVWRVWAKISVFMKKFEYVKYCDEGWWVVIFKSLWLNLSYTPLFDVPTLFYPLFDASNLCILPLYCLCLSVFWEGCFIWNDFTSPFNDQVSHTGISAFLNIPTRTSHSTKRLKIINSKYHWAQPAPFPFFWR